MNNRTIKIADLKLNVVPQRPLFHPDAPARVAEVIRNRPKPEIYNIMDAWLKSRGA